MSKIPKTFEAPNYVDAMFMDQVRQEASGKSIFLGVFGPSMIVPKFPCAPGQLVARISYTTSPDHVPSALRFAVHRGDEVLQEVVMASEELAAAQTQWQARKEKGKKDVFLRINTFIDLSHIELAGPCRLSTFVETDRHAHRGGALEVMDQMAALAQGLIQQPFAPLDPPQEPAPAAAPPARAATRPRRPPAKKAKH